MRSLIGVVLILGGLVLIQTGCAPDPPHDNPLDPNSPNYKSAGNFSGKVLTLGLPYAGVPNVLVTLLQNGSAQLTASDGSFSFPDAPSGNIAVTISKSGYLTDTLHLEVSIGGNIDTLVHIDALPQVSGARVVTTKVDHWYPGPAYSATVTATVTDPDGQVDIIDSTVQVHIDSLSFTMNRTTGSNYEVVIDDSQLPNQDLQWLVGKDIVISATDHESGAGSSAPFFVSRIIEPEAVPTSPTSLQSTVASPVLEWNPPTVSYNFTYQLQVVHIDTSTGIQAVVWSESGLSSTDLSFTYPGSLSSGTYFWTVTVIDDYGNSSRSKEASFMVK
jgi:hypothetical protein